MEFWGAEVKVGESFKVDPADDESMIHLSQAALGESKKDSKEPVVLYLKVGNQKFVMGTLNKEKFPQITLEVVLEKEFEISHNSKTASVHILGYKAFQPQSEDEFTDSEDEAALLPPIQENGKPEVKAEVAKAEGAKASQSKKPAAKVAAPAKQAKVVDPKKDDDDSDDDSEFGSSDDEMEDAGSDSDEEGESSDDDDDDEEETPPKKVDQGKKRPNDSASKTPVPSKKAKNATPEKTDGKKGGHTATPHPGKKGGKSPNSEAKTPKSGGQFSCKSCSKNFNSESGFQQHNKAKHGQ